VSCWASFNFRNGILLVIHKLFNFLKGEKGLERVNYSHVAVAKIQLTGNVCYFLDTCFAQSLKIKKRVRNLFRTLST
jgi:hypothetical protein